MGNRQSLIDLRSRWLELKKTEIQEFADSYAVSEHLLSEIIESTVARSYAATPAKLVDEVLQEIQYRAGDSPVRSKKNKLNAAQAGWLDDLLRDVPNDGSRAQDELRAYLRAVRCNSASPETFRIWARKNLERMLDANLCSTDTSEQYAQHVIKGEMPPAFSGLPDDVYQNGDVLLIPVGEYPDGSSVIWRLPAEQNEFAGRWRPSISLHRLPPCELPEKRALRLWKSHIAQARKKAHRLTGDDYRFLYDELARRQESCDRAIAWEKEHPALPRYELQVPYCGHLVGLHRIFTNASAIETVAAHDGDFLNFCTVPHKIYSDVGFTMSERGGVAWAAFADTTTKIIKDEKIDNPFIVQGSNNFRPSHSQLQRDFEKGFQQSRISHTEDGEPITDASPKAKILPNRTLGRNVNIGHWQLGDAGWFHPSQDTFNESVQESWHRSLPDGHKRDYYPTTADPSASIAPLLGANSAWESPDSLTADDKRELAQYELDNQNGAGGVAKLQKLWGVRNW